MQQGEKMVEGEIEGRRRQRVVGEGEKIMARSIYVFDFMCFNEYIHKGPWLPTQRFGHLYADIEHASFWQWIFFDSFDSKTIFLNEQEKKAKKKSYHAAIKPCLAHICTKRSHKCGMSSIQNSFHTGVNSLFSSQRFVLARSLYFRLNFMCPKVCWCFLGEEVGKKI